MKRLAGIILGLWGAIALPATGLAQVRPDAAADRETRPLIVETRSEFLLTEPISLNGSQVTNSAAFKIYDATRLREVTESLRVKPGSGSKILNAIPPDLIHTPSSSSTDSRAIDFFQVPRPDPSVGINFNTQ